MNRADAEVRSLRARRRRQAKTLRHMLERDKDPSNTMHNELSRGERKALSELLKGLEE